MSRLWRKLKTTSPYLIVNGIKASPWGGINNTDYHFIYVSGGCWVKLPQSENKMENPGIRLVNFKLQMSILHRRRYQYIFKI